MMLVVHKPYKGAYRRKNRTAEESAKVQAEGRKKAAEKMKANNTYGTKADKDFTHTPKVRHSPVAIAQNVLGGRLQERDTGNGLVWLLDDFPAGLNQIMQETNRILKLRGQEQIDLCARWVL